MIIDHEAPLECQLRGARERACVSVADAARACGICEFYLSRMEEGTKLPSVAALRRLAKLYDCAFVVR